MGSLVKQDRDPSWQEILQKCDALVKSGFLPKAIDNKEKAAVIWMMSDALNLHPMIGFQQIHIIAKKPSVAPELMLALCRRTGQLESFKYHDTGDTAIVEMKRRGEPLHTEKFSMTDADALTTTEWSKDKNGNSTPRTIKLSEKQNWKEQPRVMRKWRAVSAACRLIFPDAVWGIASYTPDELGANVNYSEDGDVISVGAEVVESAPTAPINDTPPEETLEDVPIVRWIDTDGYTMLLKRTKKQLGMEESEVSEFLGRALNSFDTENEAVEAIRAAVTKQAETPPAKPKKALTWFDKEKNTLSAWLRGWWGLSLTDALKALDAKSWESFADFETAKSAVRTKASAQLWPIQVIKASYTGKRVIFATPIGEMTLFSRKDFAAKACLSDDPERWSEVKDWTEGQHDLPDPIWLNIVQKGEVIVLNDDNPVTNASVPF